MVVQGGVLKGEHPMCDIRRTIQHVSLYFLILVHVEGAKATCVRQFFFSLFLEHPVFLFVAEISTWTVFMTRAGAGGRCQAWQRRPGGQDLEPPGVASSKRRGDGGGHREGLSRALHGDGDGEGTHPVEQLRKWEQGKKSGAWEGRGKKRKGLFSSQGHGLIPTVKPNRTKPQTQPNAQLQISPNSTNVL